VKATVATSCLLTAGRKLPWPLITFGWRQTGKRVLFRLAWCILFDVCFSSLTNKRRITLQFIYVLFWDMTPCGLFKVIWRFGGTCRFHAQGRRISQASFLPALRRFVSWLFLWLWRWRQYVPPKRLLTFNGLQHVYVSKDRTLLNNRLFVAYLSQTVECPLVNWELQNVERSYRVPVTIAAFV
jgi:hypothetical protein